MNNSTWDFSKGYCQIRYPQTLEQLDLNRHNKDMWYARNKDRLKARKIILRFVGIPVADEIVFTCGKPVINLNGANPDNVRIMTILEQTYTPADRVYRWFRRIL